MKNYKTGWWAKGLGLSGSQVDYLKSVMAEIERKASELNYQLGLRDAHKMESESANAWREMSMDFYKKIKKMEKG